MGLNSGVGERRKKMIKCLCKENVQDRITGEHYVAGKEYDFTEERAAEVTKSRYFEYANGWAVTEEKDGVHVRLIKNGEILDTPVAKIEKPKKARKSTKK
jgi:hypothetical protein